jgi:hypothetical protein
VIIRLERACWVSASLDVATSAIATFSHRVLAELETAVTVDHER